MGNFKIRAARTLIVVAATTTMMLAAASPSHAAGAPVVNCGQYAGNSTYPAGRYCNASSHGYYNVVGWYGYVGHGGGACGPMVPGDTSDGMAGVCVVPEPIAVWRWTSTGWKAASLNVSTRVYVYPYDRMWRWIWSDGHWYAIQAEDLRLVWRA